MLNYQNESGAFACLHLPRSPYPPWLTKSSAPSVWGNEFLRPHDLPDATRTYGSKQDSHKYPLASPNSYLLVDARIRTGRAIFPRFPLLLHDHCPSRADVEFQKSTRTSASLRDFLPPLRLPYPTTPEKGSSANHLNATEAQSAVALPPPAHLQRHPDSPHLALGDSCHNPPGHIHVPHHTHDLHDLPFAEIDVAHNRSVGRIRPVACRNLGFPDLVRHRS